MALPQDNVGVFRDFQADGQQFHGHPYTTFVDSLAGPGELDNFLLAHLAAKPQGRTSFKHLLRELGARGEQRARIEEALDRLVAKGKLIETRGGHYVLPRATQEYAVGRLNMHRDGYGFVIPDESPAGIRGDIFLPPAAARAALHGDRVVARITHVYEGRAEGEILRVLRRANTTLVGEFRLGRKFNYVVPHDTRIRHQVMIPEGYEVPESPGVDRVGAIATPKAMDGVIVDVEILEFPEDDDVAIGRVVEVLGQPDDFGVDVEIIIRKHHLPHRFPANVLEQAERISGIIQASELQHRMDFRDMEIVTIDGETARDFDDAVWVDALPGGNYALHVHIADVSHYVQPGSPIDDEAALRGTSVYFPDRAVPMLPLELSTGICSLKPGVDRLVLSALLEIDRRGDVVRQQFSRGVIRSMERMTYTNVQLLLEGDPGIRERYSALIPRFELMKELALVLNRKRVKRGSIDFDLPEPLILFDEEGIMTGIARSPRNIAHRIIEEFMLAANEAVAAHLESSGLESIYRIHEPPDAARVFEFEEVAVRFGHSLGVGALPVKRFDVSSRGTQARSTRREVIRPDERFAITSRHYQKLVARLEGRPEERILSYLMLRSLKQARYSTRNTGHFALAAQTYTHFTSPIRRYPDLLVHRLLGAVLDRVNPPQAPLADLAESCSHTERRAAEAERELVEWKKVKFMIDRIGDHFAALIISTTKFGFFVELDDLFVEGLVPIDTLPGERYNYQESTRRITGDRTRRQFAIGDRITVSLDQVDAVEKKLYFSVVDPVAARSGKRRR